VTAPDVSAVPEATLRLLEGAKQRASTPAEVAAVAAGEAYITLFAQPGHGRAAREKLWMAVCTAFHAAGLKL
jgi:hypothetical protein